ncbi:unnamed protein product [Moneuplotes crassus]|uniref:Uncharacterized protein n=1 Tax=Euplotes crassus TaxID=5936 RepID=A0AAD1TZD2_EUPCR|nr:unnamed protein product [Moneuplotes crassus]
MKLHLKSSKKPWISPRNHAYSLYPPTEFQLSSEDIKKTHLNPIRMIDSLELMDSPSSTGQKDLIAMNKIPFKKLFQSHTQSNQKYILFPELANICKKIGLFPEFLNYKEIKAIICDVKKVNGPDASIQSFKITFDNFLEFLHKCSDFYEVGKLHKNNRNSSKCQRAKTTKIKDLKGSSMTASSKEFISLIQSRVKFNYQINLKVSHHAKNFSKNLTRNTSKKIMKSPTSQSKLSRQIDSKACSKQTSNEAQNAPVCNTPKLQKYEIDLIKKVKKINTSRKVNSTSFEEPFKASFDNSAMREYNMKVKGIKSQSKKNLKKEIINKPKLLEDIPSKAFIESERFETNFRNSELEIIQQKSSNSTLFSNYQKANTISHQSMFAKEDSKLGRKNVESFQNPTSKFSLFNHSDLINPEELNESIASLKDNTQSQTNRRTRKERKIVTLESDDGNNTHRIKSQISHFNKSNNLSPKIDESLHYQNIKNKYIKSGKNQRNNLQKKRFIVNSPTSSLFKGGLRSTLLVDLDNDDDYMKKSYKMTPKTIDKRKYLSLSKNSHNKSSLSIGMSSSDVIGKIKSTFERFIENNDKIQSARSLENLHKVAQTINVQKQNKITNTAIGLGILQGILGPKRKKLLRKAIAELKN